MATRTQPAAASPPPPPSLETGDRLTRAEFERRYSALPDLKKAELLEGVVYVSSPVRLRKHGFPHGELITWLGTYRSATAGTIYGDNASARLDLDNEPQPDGMLLILPECGGQAKITDDDYVEGGPELAGEVAASSVSIDLNLKLKVYRRNEVQEYIVWRVLDRQVDWFRLRDGDYVRLPTDADGIIRSEVFPGLWLDAAALVGGDMQRVLAVVAQGVASADHAAFVAKLADRRGTAKEKPTA